MSCVARLTSWDPEINNQIKRSMTLIRLKLMIIVYIQGLRPNELALDVIFALHLNLLDSFLHFFFHMFIINKALGHLSSTTYICTTKENTDPEP